MAIFATEQVRHGQTTQAHEIRKKWREFDKMADFADVAQLVEQLIRNQ